MIRNRVLSTVLNNKSRMSLVKEKLFLSVNSLINGLQTTAAKGEISFVNFSIDVG